MRFPGFEGEWERKKLGEVCEIKTGNKDTQNKIDDGKYPFFVRSNTVERIDTYSYDGEAILTSGDGVGVGKNFHYIDGKFDFHQRVYALRNFQDGYNGRFIYYFFSEKFHDRVRKLSAKNSVDSVRMDMISGMDAHFPLFTEQQKIASFLSLIDERIQTQNKIIAQLQTLMQGLDEQLFKQQIRFKDENGNNFPDWEEKKLGEVAECLDNLRKPLNEIERQKIQGKYPYWGANNIMDYINDYIFDETIVLLAEDGGNFNDFKTKPIANLSNGKCWVNNHTHVLRGIKNVLFTDYLYYSLVHKDIIGFISGGTRSKLTKGEMLKIPILIPCPKEQISIADFLSSIDKKIETEKKVLLQYENQKKYLLQNMFI